MQNPHDEIPSLVKLHSEQTACDRGQHISLYFQVYSIPDSSFSLQFRLWSVPRTAGKICRHHKLVTKVYDSTYDSTEEKALWPRGLSTVVQ